TAEGNAIASGTGPTSESFAWEGSGLGAGTHTLTLSARDIAGNAAERSVTVQLVAPTAVPPTEQSSNPAPLGMVVPSAPTATRAPIPSGTPAATRTPSTSSLGGLPAVPLSGEEGLPDEPEAGPETASAASAQGSSSGVLWGGAAVALVGAAMAAALEAARRRKEEEARLKEEMERRNAEAERREAEMRQQAGLARAAALAAAAVEAARRRRDQLFEDRELRGEVEETGSAGGTAQGGEAPHSGEEERVLGQPPLGDRLRAVTEASDEAPLPASTRAEALPLEGGWVARSLRLTRAARNALTARAVMFRTLESGRISVSAPSRALGTRRMYLQRYGFRGTSYNPSTIRGITGKHLLSGALSRGAWITALVTSTIGNVIDYGFGRNRDKGIGSQEFFVSTAVDTVLAVGTGVAAAALVALVLPATAPVWGAIAVTALVGLGIGYLMDRLGIAQRAKDYLNAGVDAVEPAAIEFGERTTTGLHAWGGIADNARVIARVAADRARDGVEQAVRGAAEAAQGAISAVTNTVQDATRAVRDQVTGAAEAARGVFANAAGTVRDFFGQLFGGG
ncbi:MAG: hypothetical protein AB1449_14960, partial [Chloroflexota bacterium]